MKSEITITGSFSAQPENLQEEVNELFEDVRNQHRDVEITSIDIYKSQIANKVVPWEKYNYEIIAEK